MHYDFDMFILMPNVLFHYFLSNNGIIFIMSTRFVVRNNSSYFFNLSLLIFFSYGLLAYSLDPSTDGRKSLLTLILFLIPKNEKKNRQAQKDSLLLEKFYEP